MECELCGQPMMQAATGRRARFCSTRCRTAHHRREKRYAALTAACNETPSLKGQLVLELFPGAGLFGRSFEALGATVVRGPDILWGGDIRQFQGLAGRIDGIIGGPPCQAFSRAAISGSSKANLIPEFIRLVKECQPRWAVMENVREAEYAAPEWPRAFLRDWDCGGETHRRRGFWFWGMDAPPVPLRRSGRPEYSVLASSWNQQGTSRTKGYRQLAPRDAARLQGFPDLADAIMEGQPGWRVGERWSGVSDRSRKVLAVHMLGNGVPKALGLYVAKWVAMNLRYQTMEMAFPEVAEAIHEAK